MDLAFSYLVLFFMPMIKFLIGHIMLMFVVYIFSTVAFVVSFRVDCFNCVVCGSCP
uniref:Uncharacterized protein n=1 Tax=Babesia bovis TaxID=5865 RepID=S6B586_BABBO|nr:hypothetical protein [Babesia bovis]